MYKDENHSKSMILECFSLRNAQHSSSFPPVVTVFIYFGAGRCIPAADPVRLQLESQTLTHFTGILHHQQQKAENCELEEKYDSI